MDFFEASLGRLHQLRFPLDLSFTRDGRAVIAAVRPAAHEPGQSPQTRVWRFSLDGTEAVQLTNGPGGDGLPHPSPLDGTLAFVSDRALKGRMSLFLKDESGERPIGDVAGTIEDMRWAPDGRSLIVLAADRGLDGGVSSGAQRLTWGEPEDPEVTSPVNARRRLFRVSIEDGSTVEVGPSPFSVWEFELFGDDAALAVVSTDPSERGWYHAVLAKIDLATRAATVLHRSRWQLLAPSVDPSARRVAFLDGWSSDRGLVASDISILEIATGEIVTVAPGGISSITSMKWRDDDSLWFAGWSRLGSVYGVTRLDGSVEWMTREDAIIGTSSFSAGITIAPDKKGLAAVRESGGAPPEIVFKSGAEASSWSALSNLNGDVAKDFNAYPEIHCITWKGADGLDLEGLVLLPRDGAQGPRPTIVEIHGGPSWAVRYAYNPGYALPFAAAGYAVFLPNYRGNVGWGKTFGMLNIGDPAGAEFQDILAGLDRCIAAGISDPDRLGISGASYGGYLTAWAVATTNRFKAAVMVSGVANQLSSHYSCNHDFHAFINGGPLSEERYRRVAVDRSAITRLDRPTTPTLVIHGDGDRCTPLGQAQELYAALLERGVESELVVYPREGHGVRERDHQLDSWRRMIGWFDRYVRTPR
jgi:dipeptidyl aminopeptidase/acylaminoacyl peptidase